MLELSTEDNKTAYFSTFTINKEAISTLLSMTSPENAQRILQAVKSVGENAKEETISFAGVSENYIEDVKKYSPEAQKLFMNVFNKYSHQYE